jgi:hypothetical protein
VSFYHYNIEYIVHNYLLFQIEISMDIYIVIPLLVIVFWIVRSRFINHIYICVVTARPYVLLLISWLELIWNFCILLCKTEKFDRINWIKVPKNNLCRYLNDIEEFIFRKSYTHRVLEKTSTASRMTCYKSYLTLLTTMQESIRPNLISIDLS